jgi:hypothetical protein
MDFVEEVWVSKERAEAGFGTKIDRPAAILGTREISGIGIAKDPSAKGDEAFVSICMCRMLGHFKNRLFQISTEIADSISVAV